jgi:hypothetical protein
MSAIPTAGPDNSAARATLSRRAWRVQIILLLCVLFIPVGCVTPLGVAQVYFPVGNVNQGLVLAAVLLPFLGLGGILLMVGDWRRYGRALRFVQMADDKGLTYVEAPDSRVFSSFIALPLFRKGRDGSTEYLIVGDVEGFLVTVMDYSYSQELLSLTHQKYAVSWTQTVVVVEMQTRRVPSLVIQPKGLLGALDEMLGIGTSLELPRQPDFNDHFRLISEDRDGARRCLDSTVVRRCLSRGELTLEMRGGYLAIYQTRRRAYADEVPGLIAHALWLVRALDSKA